MNKSRTSPVARALGLSLIGVLLLGGCAGERLLAPPEKPLELTIAHINDHHSQLAANPGGMPAQLTLDGVATQVDLGGFARQSALFKSLAGRHNLLKIHAGDALTGTQYYSYFKGAADAAMMNTVCFDAFVPGNHEFDDGDAGLRGFLDELAHGDCRTPALSANIVAAAGTPLAPGGRSPYLEPYRVLDIDGVKVGLIGITTARKTMNSSRPLASTAFNDETTAAQGAIDELKAQGVRHIILITHQGYDADREMAARLSDVDVIIGGDSHTLLGDFAAVGLPSGGKYPTLARNRSGEPVCIGQAWEYAKAIGVMQVRFDAAGAVASCDGQATLLIGDNFKRQDAAGNWQPLPDAERAALRARLAATPGAVTVIDPDAAAAATLERYTQQIAGAGARPLGTASEALCLVRVPGETGNASSGVAGCADANTLARGSDIAQVVAEGFLYAAKRADFALQNGGGVRIPLPAGKLTMSSAFTLLPFSNSLVELDITGAQMIAALEDGVDRHLSAGANGSGAHPYAAGLRWNLDMSRAKGQRLSQVEVRDRKSGSWAAIDPERTYVLVTSDFLAAGKDGYTTLGEISRTGHSVNTGLLYTQSFIDYVLAQGEIKRPPRSDYSHQKVVNRDGQLLP